MEFRWTQEALDEYRDAAAYYEMRQPGLGKRFMQCVDGAEAEAMVAPERPRLIHPKCHRVRLAHFPYNFVYTLKGDNGLVLALMHQHRQPGYWHKRIE